MESINASTTTSYGQLPTHGAGALAIETFIPGYYSFVAIFNYFGLTMPSIVTFLLITTAAAASWQYWYDFLSMLTFRFLMATAQIRSHDELYQHLMAWIAEQEFSNSAKYFVAGMAFSSLQQENENMDEDEDETKTDMSTWEMLRRAPLQFTPAPGLHMFRYRGRMVLLRRVLEEGKDYWFRMETIELSTFGTDPGLLKELLREARLRFLEKDRSKTVVYRPTIGTQIGQPPNWARCLARPSRALSTVVLDECQKEMFCDDIRDYLEPDTRKWYADRGIPYRRGYLLHGPPGTGKSSLSFAVAGKFGLKIYVLSLASKSLTEEGLAGLFEGLPRKCVVLLEDVDTVGIARVNKKEETTGEGADKTTAKKDEPDNSKKGISFSGLLNAIDGVASHEGRILILTTNHPEKLDPALIRPGRVDMKIEFTLAGKDAIGGLFERMFEDYSTSPSPSPSTPPKPSPKDSKPLALPSPAAPEPEKKEQEDETEAALAKKQKLKELTAKFVELVPDMTFSPAEIQGFLLQHKNRPERALERTESWVKSKLEAKATGKID